METPFEPWIGQPAIVRLTLRRNTLSLRGTVLKEQTETLLMRAENGPDLEISKNAVLAIEQVGAQGVERHRPCLQEFCEKTFSSQRGENLGSGCL